MGRKELRRNNTLQPLVQNGSWPQLQLFPRGFEIPEGYKCRACFLASFPCTFLAALVFDGRNGDWATANAAGTRLLPSFDADSGHGSVVAAVRVIRC